MTGELLIFLALAVPLFSALVTYAESSVTVREMIR